MANSELRAANGRAAIGCAFILASCSCYSLFASPLSYPARIEYRLLAGAVALERALLADGVGALENPVLPRGEAGEDFRFHGLRAAEAQIGFEPGQAVGGKACALLQKHADLVLPVDVVEREGDETQPLRRFGIEHLAGRGLRPVEVGRIGQETARKPRKPVRHRISAEIDRGERQRRRRLVVAPPP